MKFFMKILGFDPKKHKYYWELYGFFSMLFASIFAALVMHYAPESTLLQIIKAIGFNLALIAGFGIIYTIWKIYDLFFIQEDIDHVFVSQQNTEVEGKEDNGQEKWEEVLRLFHTQDPQHWKLAILNADALLEEALRAYGYEGENLGEILKKIPAQTDPWVHDAWRVHKLRNEIAHNTQNAYLSERELIQAEKTYERLLRMLHFI